jgi:serine protease Do
VDTADAPVLTWRDEPVEQGEVVFAAAPAGAGTRVAAGHVTLTGRAFRGPRGRRIPGSIEHNALLARGSSGGPLLDADGRVVGLNTHRLGDGFTLAIPADAELRRRVEDLGRGEAPTRRRLGVAVAPAAVARRMRRAVGLPDRDGLLVRGVEDGSPAATAGLRAGDLLVRAAGVTLETADDLFTVLDRATDAATLELVVVRGTEDQTVVVAFNPAGT